MNTPLVSVIIPNYNYLRYLELRISSVLHQTCKDIEIILLDDASTDGSQDYLESLSAIPQVTHIIYNQTNTGSPFSQWEKGLELARGKYIWIAEADDLADVTFLQKLLPAMEYNDQIVLSFSASQMIDTEGQAINKDYDHLERRKYTHTRLASIYDGTAFVKKNMYWRNWVYNASGVLFRRSAITEKALKALSMHYSGDWLFWSNIANQGKVVEYHERLNKFRFHTSSTTHKGAYMGFIEDIDIVKTFNRDYSISTLKRWIRGGRFFRRMSKMGFSQEQTNKIRQKISEDICPELCGRLADLLSKICPWLASETHDSVAGQALQFPLQEIEACPK